MMRLGRLWRNHEFSKLWFGQTISLFGSQITALALPSLAILVLHATPIQVGALEAAYFVAFPVLGLFVGVWVDRHPRRPTMIVADCGRLLVLTSLPVAAVLHHLAMLHLYVVALASGTLAVFFEIAYQSFLPTVVARADLVEGNSKLEISRQLAQIFGNGAAGALVQLIGAATAIAFDALSYLISAISLVSIRIREPELRNLTSDGAAARSVLHDVREGLGVVLHNPVLRSIAICTGTVNLGASIVMGIYLIYLYRELHLAAATVGVVVALGEIGFLGVMATSFITRRLGIGWTLVVSLLIGSAGLALLPLARVVTPVPALIASGMLVSLCTPIYNITQVSLRQAITPDALQGRMNATMRTIAWSSLPLGNVIGGALGGTIGVVPTLLVGAFFAIISVLWILTSPVIRLREAPTAAKPLHGPVSST